MDTRRLLAGPSVATRRGGAATWRRLLCTALGCVALQCAGSERQFAEALQQYKAGRHADAFGRLTRLANDGDVDAAHIALFMHQYGPLLYGSYWDAVPDELADWRALVNSRPGRKHPVFVPAAVPVKVPSGPGDAGTRRKTGTQATRFQ